MKTYVFKMYHSKRNKHLYRSINLAGSIYNHLIALHRRYYRLFKKTLSCFRLQKHITKLKKTRRFQHWNQLGSQALQNIAERIDRAYKLFFVNLKSHKRTAPPGFKKVRKYKSFMLKTAGYKLLEGNKLRIGKRTFSYFKSREIEGAVKTLTVKRDSVGDLWLYFVVDENLQTSQARSGQSVGLDFGLKTFLTTSEGRKIESPLFFKQDHEKIRRLCKKLSSKKQGSKNREKARLNLARQYRHIAWHRQDFHFKLALELALAYGLICIEDLNIKAMQRLWGRKISDLGFAEFVKILQWQCFKNGSELRKISRTYPSSQICSNCGAQWSGTKDLSVRKWFCPECGALHDRDVNAAVNILRAGTSAPKGENLRPALAGCFC